jgi:hypothetical protein
MYKSSRRIGVGLFKLYFSHHCVMARTEHRPTYELNNMRALLLLYYPAASWKVLAAENIGGDV